MLRDIVLSQMKARYKWSWRAAKSLYGVDRSLVDQWMVRCLTSGLSHHLHTSHVLPATGVRDAVDRWSQGALCVFRSPPRSEALVAFPPAECLFRLRCGELKVSARLLTLQLFSEVLHYGPMTRCASSPTTFYTKKYIYSHSVLR